MNIILASTSTLFGGNYLEYLTSEIENLFRGIDEIIFIPFARPGGISHDEYTEKARSFFATLSIKYLKPGLYDEILEIHTYIKKLPGVRIEFEYEIYNSSKEKITEAKTTLFFLDAKTNKVVKCPEFLMTLLQKNWKESL